MSDCLEAGVSTVLTTMAGDGRQGRRRSTAVRSWRYDDSTGLGQQRMLVDRPTMHYEC